MNEKEKGFILKKKSYFSVTVIKTQSYASIEANQEKSVTKKQTLHKFHHIWVNV